VLAQDIGLQLYSVRNQIPGNVEETLKTIKSWGITELEGGDTYGYSDQEFLKLCAKYNLKLVAVGADFKELESEVPKVIARAKSLGVNRIVCYGMPHAGVSLTVKEAQRAIDVFNKAGKQLAKSKINLYYHPHGFEFAKAGADAPGYDTVFDFFVDKILPENMNFEMDVFWAKQAGQDPVALLRKYPKRFKMLHLKDRQPGTPDSQDGHADVETNVVLGEGDVGIAEIMRVSKEIGIEHYFIEDECSRVMTQVPKSMDFLRSLRK